jgi:hypothetical protein
MIHLKNTNSLRALFYSLLIAFFFIPKFDGVLSNFDGNQIGEATLYAVDIQSRVTEVYIFIGLITVAYLALFFLFTKLFQHEKTKISSLENSILIAGCIQVLSAYFVPNLAVLFVFPGAFHIGLLALQFFDIDVEEENIFSSIAAVLIAWLLLIWLIPISINPLFHLAFLLLSFISLLLFSSKKPNFNLATTVNTLSILSILPLICTELNYFLREKIGFNINGIFLSLILIALIISIAFFRYKRKHNITSTATFAWLLIACGMGIQTFYHPFGIASTEIFELANRATPLMELHFFHQIPLLEKASSHLVSDYGFGLIYQAIYGYHGLDFMVFDIFESLAWITFSFILIYQITENKLAAFYFVAFFPFFDSSITPYYAFALLPLICLIEAFKNNTKFSSWLFGISFAFLFPWRADLSFAILISTFVVIGFGIYLKRISYKFLIPTFISLGILGILLLSIALTNNIDWIGSLKSTLDYLQSSQSYGLINIGDQSSNQFIFHHFIIPILVLGVLFLALKNTLKSFSKQAVPIIITILYLSIFYFVNLPRGIVRHGFAEGFDNFLDSYAPFIIIIGFTFLVFQNKFFRFWTSIIALCIFQVFLRYPNRSPENGLALAGLNNSYHQERIPFRHQSQRLKTDTAKLQKNVIPMVNFLRENLKDGETFLDFGNTPMLYFYAEKPVPAFFYQSPQNVHSISLQEDWIARMANYKIPIFLFRHYPKEWWDATDGVPNELRHYLIAEYAYQRYFPSNQVAGYEVWKLKSKNQTNMPEFMQARFYEYMNLLNLPAIWNPNLMNVNQGQLKSDTLKIEDELFNESHICQISSKAQNWIVLNLKNSTDTDVQVRISLMHDIHPFGGYDFAVKPMTNGTYKVRLSMLPSWWFKKINYIRILVPKGVVVEDVTFASDSN